MAQITRLPDTMLKVIAANNGLKQYLASLLRGRPATPRSWLYEGRDAREVLADWMEQLRSDLSNNPHGEDIYQFETSQLKKFGPQGEVAPVTELTDLIMEGFNHVQASPPAEFKSNEWKTAKALAVEYLTGITGRRTLTPRSYEKVIDDMSARDTLESNSGWPLFTRRKDPKVIQHSLDAIHTGEYLEFPAVLLFRNYNQKTRPVWMYPMSVNIVEGSFTQPLKEAIQNSDAKFFAAWRGYDHVLSDLSAVYDQGEFITASDFSHTDAYFDKWKMLEVYDVIKECFQEKYWSELKQALLRVTTIPLVVGPDSWIVGDHGVSSGSNFTNDVETYMDLICEFYLMLKKLVSQLLNAIGDDISHRNSQYNPELADMLARVYQMLDFDVNGEKVTNFRDKVKYLQRLVIRNYRRRDSQTCREVYGDAATEAYLNTLRGIYSTIRALNSSLLPEKFHSPKLWSFDMFAARQSMIGENCVDHPSFIPFAKFLANGHPKLVTWAKQKDSVLNEVKRQSHLVPGLNPTYNQEKRDKPLSEFAIIRVWRSL